MTTSPPSTPTSTGRRRSPTWMVADAGARVERRATRSATSGSSTSGRVLALTDADAFARRRRRRSARRRRTRRSRRSRRACARPGELIGRWRADRRRLVDVARTVDPAPASRGTARRWAPGRSSTARLMETWAHGQDVADALGVTRAPTDRLRHVAHIGVRARPFSYAVNGREPPDAEVHVELDAPVGRGVDVGPADADDRVTGPALDFCLVVTQRRHVDDVGLTSSAPTADEWMTIAQAFAGPPGEGRAARAVPLQIDRSSANDLGVAQARTARRARRAGCGSAAVEGVERRPVAAGGVHRRLELALVGLERGELGVDLRRRRPRRGSGRRPRTAAAPSAGGGRCRARGRSADRGRATIASHDQLRRRAR